MSRVDRIIELLDNAHETTREAAYGHASEDADPDACFRCQRHPHEDDGDLCSGCRAFLLGDSDEDPKTTRATRVTLADMELLAVELSTTRPRAELQQSNPSGYATANPYVPGADGASTFHAWGTVTHDLAGMYSEDGERISDEVAFGRLYAALRVVRDYWHPDRCVGGPLDGEEVRREFTERSFVIALRPQFADFMPDERGRFRDFTPEQVTYTMRVLRVECPAHVRGLRVWAPAGMSDGEVASRMFQRSAGLFY